MSGIKDGGCAFPFVLPNERGPDGEAIAQGYHEQGMSLRDWFAGQALIGILRDPSETSRKCAEFAMEDMKAGKTASSFSTIVASSCYGYADALIAERDQSLTRSVLARDAVGHIKDILETKDHEGVDIEIGSTALKSLIRWAREADAALR